MAEITKIAACVLSQTGQLLPWTCQSTVERCEEDAASGKLFAPGVWEGMQMFGAKVVQVEIKVIG